MKRAFLLLVLSFAFAACSVQTTLTPGETPGAANSSFISPLAGQSPLATPPATDLVPPTPSRGKATVLGTLIVMDPRYGTPLNGNGIYLVPVKDETQALVMPEVDPKTSYQATVNAQAGTFLFTEIPPGKYRLTVVTFLGTLLARNVATGSTETLTIQADQTLDLGQMQIP